jgi:mannose-1-phosphate guanylyltransferase/phosphomannomutase
LLQENQPLFGHLTGAYWKDVGNLQVYRKTQYDALEGRVKLNLPAKERKKYVWMGENVEIHPTAEIGYPVFIGDNVKIEENAKVFENSIIGNNCTVEMGSTIKETILWEGAVVMRNTHLERCVVGNNCHVKTNAAVFDGVIVDPTRSGKK